MRADNPLVALVRRRHPDFGDDQALAMARKWRSQYSAGITELGYMANATLEILKAAERPQLVALGFRNLLAEDSPTRAMRKVVEDDLPELKEFITATLDKDPVGKEELRSLLQDCIRMAQGSAEPPAE